VALTFSEAEARFWQLKGMRSAGRLDQAAFESALRDLMVQDPAGCWWMPHQETGQWHVFDGAKWAPAAPPATEGARTVAPRSVGSDSGAVAGARSAVASPAAENAAGGLGMMAALIVALVFWAAVAVGVAVFVSPQVVLGVGAAALISIVLMLRTYRDAWEGVIERVEKRRVRVNRGDDDFYWEDQLFSIVRLANGRTKDLRWIKGWEVGDRLVKRRGEVSIRTYQR